MNKIISGYLWAYKNIDSGIKSLQSLQKYYPNSDLFVNVDFEGDYIGYKKEGDRIGAITTINKFQLGYCGNFGNVHVGYDCWSKKSTFEWFNQFYNACKSSDSYYMILLEEDDFILKPISLLEYDFDIAIHPTDPSPTGRIRPNFINTEFFEYSKMKGGTDTCPGYASGGGTIVNREKFILAWDTCKDYFYQDYDSLVKINKIIGWVDFSLQFIMMLGGYQVIQNTFLCEHWEVPEHWNQFEIITGLKDHTLITL